MSKHPILTTLALIAIAVLVILNWNLRPKETQSETIDQAQALVANGSNNPQQLAEGLRIASSFLSKDPRHAQALFVQAWAQQRSGMPDQAIQNYELLFAQLNELGKYGHFNTAVLQEAKGQSDKALDNFLAAVQIDPTLDYAWARAAGLLIRMGKKEEAKIVVDQGLESSPNSKELQQIKSQLK